MKKWPLWTRYSIITVHKCSLASGWWPDILPGREENLFHVASAVGSLSAAFAPSEIGINFTTPGKAQSLFSAPPSCCRKNWLFYRPFPLCNSATLSMWFPRELSSRGPHSFSNTVLLIDLFAFLLITLLTLKYTPSSTVLFLLCKYVLFPAVT